LSLRLLFLRVVHVSEDVDQVVQTAYHRKGRSGGLPCASGWRVQLEEKEQVFVVEPVHGRIFTEGNKGIAALDLATGGEVGRLKFPDSPRFYFAEAHGLLASWHSERDGREVVSCWEVPLRPPWAWGLAALALAGRRSLQRWRNATPPGLSGTSALLERQPVPNSRSPASPRPGTM
jgi:hypothetical protein